MNQAAFDIFMAFISLGMLAIFIVLILDNSNSHKKSKRQKYMGKTVPKYHTGGYVPYYGYTSRLKKKKRNKHLNKAKAIV